MREPQHQQQDETMTYQITDTQLKAHAISIGLINPHDFDAITLQEITEIAHTCIHSMGPGDQGSDLNSRWVKVLDAATWLNQEDIEARLSDDKFGFTAATYQKSIAILEAARLI